MTQAGNTVVGYKDARESCEATETAASLDRDHYFFLESVGPYNQVNVLSNEKSSLCPVDSDIVGSLDDQKSYQSTDTCGHERQL